MMRKTFAYISKAVILLLIAIFCITISAEKVIVNAASNLIQLRYVYLAEEICAVDIPFGTTIATTIIIDNYREELNLADGYTLEWHIGSETGEKWTKEYVFVTDINFYGVAILKESPKEDATPPQTPEENNPEKNNPEEDKDEHTDENSAEEPGQGSEENSGETIGGEKEPSDASYKIVVNSDNDNFTVTGEPKEGERITVLFAREDKISAVTVFCNGNPVVFGRNNNEIYFYMPKGDVCINCSYGIEDTKKKSILNAQEIIALSIVGGGAVLCGVYVIVKGILAKKSTKSKSDIKQT